MADADEVDLVEGLRSAPRSAWMALWSAVDDLGATGLESTWRGGEPSPDNERLIHIPWVEHSVEFGRVVVALYDVQAVAPFDWMDWYDEARYPNGEGLESAPLDDIVRMMTVVVRSDRFSEGSLKAAVDSGVFGLLLGRLRDWYDAGGATPGR
jgi:hypothetical protein